MQPQVRIYPLQVDSASLGSALYEVYKGKVSAIVKEWQLQNPNDRHDSRAMRVNSTIQALAKEIAASKPNMQELEQVIHKAREGLSAKK